MIVTTSKGLTVKVRPFEEADINRVLEIEMSSFLEGDAQLYLELHEEWPQGFLVAELEGTVIGFIVLVFTPEGDGRVFALAVDARYRGRGVGRLLLKAAFNTLRKRKIGYVRLEVRLTNHVAQQLYRSTGFMEIGLVPYYYKDGEAAIMMRKVL
ncbi:MAG TPA: ribosomal-protein-alanine N-acetyltransferase [Methanomicrobia archaeon]|nr:ribosomal-protein-alanine N-acetyltransferase [Methanomicrobia archaeon]